jgi:site-specific DNA recombinase
MSKPVVRKLRCAVYTRKSSEEGLDMEFNSLDAQREACEAYVASQRAEGWLLVGDRYDDGGYSGGTLERPALKRLMADIQAGAVDVVVVYKIDRLSRSLMDFAKLVEVFERHGVTFVSVTQSFSTTTSMGRLTLNMRCRSPNSNARSLASGSGTNSRPPARRACGWAAGRRSATTSRTAN